MSASVTRLAARASRPGEPSDQALVRLVRRLPLGSQERAAACEQLVARYQALVRSCAQRYRQSPESQEELMQVGYVGLLKAINNFDPALGNSLAAYARPCISGEIKQYFRDKRWQVRVQRSAQELRHELRRARAELTQRLARAPRPDELAAYLEVSRDDLRDAERADLLFQAASLDAPLRDDPEAMNAADLLGDEDPRLEHTLDMHAVRAHWGELPLRQQRMLLLRFYGNMTQAEIGERLGISQMQVSKLLGRSLRHLRGRIVGPDAGPPRLRLVGRRPHRAHRQHRHVVAQLAAADPGHDLLHPGYHTGRGLAGQRGQLVVDAVLDVGPVRAARAGQAVADEEQHVAGIEVDLPGRGLGIGEDPEREAASL
jgi:RNA polymerase sigma-B factor